MRQAGAIARHPGFGSLVGRIDSVPAAVLSYPQRHALRAVVELCENGETSCRATMEVLAAKAGQGVAATRRAVAALEESGILKRDGASGARLWTYDLAQVLALPRELVPSSPVRSPASPASSRRATPKAVPVQAAPAEGLAAQEARPLESEGQALAHNAGAQIPSPSCSERSPQPPEGAVQKGEDKGEHRTLSYEAGRRARAEADIRARWPHDRVEAALAQAEAHAAASPAAYARRILEREDEAASMARRPQARAERQGQGSRPAPARNGCKGWFGGTAAPLPEVVEVVPDDWEAQREADDRRLAAELAADAPAPPAPQMKAVALPVPEPTERGRQGLKALSALLSQKGAFGAARTGGGVLGQPERRTA